MEQVELRYGVRTDVGRVREVNEDDLLAAPPVFAVADGMGGHDGGDVASRTAVEELRRLADDGYDPAAADAAVVEALARAQQRIADYAADRRAEGFRSSPGTTAVAAAARRVRGRAGVAGRQPRRLPLLPALARDARAGERRPQPGAAPRRLGPDHPRRGGPPPRAARRDARARWPGDPAARTCSWSRSRRRPGCCCAPTASAG